MNFLRKNYTEQNDEQLMVLVGEHNSRAFETLYDRYSSALLNYFYRMLWQDRGKAEDFMQDLFMKIVNNPLSYNPERPFKTWLYSVANNMCKNEYKKQAVRKGSNELLEGREIQGSSGLETILALDEKTFNKALTEALEDLEPIQKETFILRFKDEMSIKEISEIFECSEGTVKSRIFYTLKKLAPKLKMYHPKMA